MRPARLPTTIAVCIAAAFLLSGCVIDYGAQTLTVSVKPGPVPIYLAAPNTLSFEPGTSTAESWTAGVAQTGPALAQNTLANYGVGAGAAGAAVEFSMRMEETKVLNASQELVLKLFIRGTATSIATPTLIVATLTLDDRFMGRGDVSVSSGSLPPINGYTPVVLGMVSEEPSLPAGSTFKLRVDVRGALSDLALGLAGTAQSYLNVSFAPSLAGDVYLDSYSGATIPLEEAETGNSSSSSSSTTGPRALPATQATPPAPIPARGGVPAALLVALGPLAALFLAAPRRPGRMAGVLVAALVVAAAMAGCAGKSPAEIERDDGIESSVDAPEEERRAELAATGAGDLVGRIFHDVGLPVRQAHVSILGTDLFQTTDDRGAFGFLALAAGKYNVRIDAPGLRSLEKEDVIVRVGNVTRLEVTMVPVGDDKYAGFSSHRHDYWGTKATLELFNGATPNPRDRLENNGIPLGPLAGTSACLPSIGMNAAGAGSICVVEFFPDTVGLVPAGTAALDVTISWDANDNRIDAAGLAFIPANRITPMVMSQKENGATWHIPVSHAMADRGHQEFSFWSFFVYVKGTGSAYGFTSMADLLQGPFQVKMEARKGTVPFEPGHRDFWQGNSSIPLIEGELRAHTSYSFEDSPNENYAPTGFAWRVAPPLLVPPGTGMLEVRLDHGAPQGSTGVSTATWGVALHPANLPPRGFKMSDLTYPEETERGAGFVVYQVPLTSSLTDAYYQPKSNWMFFLDDGADRTVGFYSLGGSHYNQEFRLTVTAHLDPAYQYAVR